MTPMPPSRWSLNPEAFERLLSHLAASPAEASRAYEKLRRRLIDFFDWRGALPPEAHADETLDRVARRLQEGAIVERVAPYALGVARFVLQESYKRSLREKTALEEVARIPSYSVADVEGDQRLACLTRCLRALTEENRSLILAYYDGDDRALLSGRKMLAQQLGLSHGALRVRAHRLRGVLEECLRECLMGPKGGNEATARGHTL